jgi:hypothetical protein
MNVYSVILSPCHLVTLSIMELPLIKIVGVSASGKSALVNGLRQAGYNARPVSQEHSHVPDLWQQFEWAHFLIYLDAELEAQQQRRPDVAWHADDLALERARLSDAHAHADLLINTSAMEAATVLQVAFRFLESRQVRHSDEPLPPVAATGSTLPARD